MPLCAVGSAGARTAPDLRRPKNELMVAAHSAATGAQGSGGRAWQVVVVQAALGIGVRCAARAYAVIWQEQNAGVWYGMT
jgi:hypothetical protein